MINFSKPIAHRGLHNIHDHIVEQSFLSFDRAIRVGLPIEFDVEASFDGVPFVFHDDRFERLTNGTGLLRRSIASDIRKLRFLSNPDEGIRDLEEVLAQVNGQVPIFVDFKSRDIGVTPGVRKAVEILRSYSGELYLQTFNPFILEWVSENKFCPLGLLTSDTDLLQGRSHIIYCLLSGKLDIDYVCHNVQYMNCWTFQWVLSLKLPKLAWTIRDESDWTLARSFADGMFFEFLAPDINDWKNASDFNWRRHLGENVDRRNLCNQPNLPKRALYHMGIKSAWWSRNRYRPPKISRDILIR